MVRMAVERSDDPSVLARTEQLTVQDHALDSSVRHLNVMTAHRESRRAPSAGRCKRLRVIAAVAVRQRVPVPRLRVHIKRVVERKPAVQRDGQFQRHLPRLFADPGVKARPLTRDPLNRQRRRNCIPG